MARRRTLFGGLFGAFALFIALCALMPTLLSTGLGNRALLSFVNWRIAGRVSAERVSIGWFSGLHARGVTVHDPEGQLVVDLPRVETELTLAHLLRSPPDLGRADVQVRRADLVSYEDGSTNLTRAFGGRGRHAQGGGRGGVSLPFTGDLHATLAEATWRKPNAKPVSLSQAKSHVALESARVVVEFDGGVNAPDLPETTVHARLYGTLDRGRRLLTIAAPSFVSEGGGNRLELASGSRLSWGDAPNEVTVVLDYDLGRLAALFSPALPESLSARGRYETRLHVTGALADGEGAQRLRGLTIEPTTFGYDRIAVHGLVLTKGRIPVELRGGVLSFGDAELAANGGSIVLAGHVDLNGRTPRYVLERSQVVVRAIGLNADLAHGRLGALLPTSWGSNDVSGLVTMRLDAATLPLNKAAFQKEGSAQGTVEVARLNGELAVLEPLLGPLGKSLRLKDQQMSVPFTLEHGQVHFASSPVKADPLSVAFTGSVGLDGVLTAHSNVTASGVTTPVVIDISGTTHKPQFKLHADTNPADLVKALEKAPLEKLFEKAKLPGL